MRDELATLQDDMRRVLATNLRRLRRKMRDPKNTEFNERDSAQAQRLARSIAAFSAEVRKAGDKFDEAAAATTREQRVAIAEKWLAALEPSLLAPIVERLQQRLG